MDIRSIDQNVLSKLGGMYMHGTFLFGADILNASERKAHKFRKWFMKHFTAQFYELPEAVQHHLTSEISDREFIEFLSSCYREFENRLQERRGKERQILNCMDAEVAAALDAVLEWDVWSPPRKTDASWVLAVDENEAFRRSLILEGVNGEGYLEEDYLVDTLMLEQTGDRFMLTGQVEGADTRLRMMFSHVSVRVEQFDPVGAVMMDDPWHLLSSISYQLLEKLKLPGNYGSDREHDLIPLLEELACLNAPCDGFPLLAKIAGSHNLFKIAQMLRNAKIGKQFRLTQRLCQSDCEPFWRDIFDRIRYTQTEYPKSVDVLCDAELLSQDRCTITRALNDIGYSGSYPIFEKRGCIDGLRLVSDHSQSYFVYHEKDTVFRILCVERSLCGTPSFSFLTGTVFSSEKNIPQDIYGCLFDSNGKRLSYWVGCPDAGREDLEQMAKIAAKKAECNKLTREERALCGSPVGSGWGLFFWMFLFAGGLFGLFMTVGLVLISILVALIFGAAGEIPNLLTSIPWWQIFVFCLVGFGGSMGLIEVFARKN